MSAKEVFTNVAGSGKAADETPRKMMKSFVSAGSPSMSTYSHQGALFYTEKTSSSSSTAGAPPMGMNQSSTSGPPIPSGVKVRGLGTGAKDSTNTNTAENGTGARSGLAPQSQSSSPEAGSTDVVSSVVGGVHRVIYSTLRIINSILFSLIVILVAIFAWKFRQMWLT